MSSGSGSDSGRDRPPPREQGDENEPVEAEALQGRGAGGLGAGDGGEREVEARGFDEASEEKGKGREDGRRPNALLSFRSGASPIRHAGRGYRSTPRLSLALLKEMGEATGACEKRQALARCQRERSEFVPDRVVPLHFSFLSFFLHFTVDVFPSSSLRLRRHRSTALSRSTLAPFFRPSPSKKAPPPTTPTLLYSLCPS